MKIARPKPVETQFRRKRAPPPQATKLLLYSLLAGLIFMGTLAVVFIPRFLETPQAAVEIVDLTAAAGGRIDVNASTLQLSLSLFNATLYQDNVSLAHLGGGLGPATAALTFTDANGDRQLDAGDYFTVHATVAASYRLEVWQTDVGRLVGFYSWTGILS